MKRFFKRNVSNNTIRFGPGFKIKATELKLAFVKMNLSACVRGYCTRVLLFLRLYAWEGQLYFVQCKCFHMYDLKRRSVKVFVHFFIRIRSLALHTSYCFFFVFLFFSIVHVWDVNHSKLKNYLWFLWRREQTLFIVKAWYIKGIVTAIFYYYCLIDEC